MKRIAVTGADGFIGRYVIRDLKRDHEVVRLTRAEADLTLPGSLKKVAPVEHVVHLAGRTFVPDSWVHPQAFLLANTMGTLEVAQFCARIGASLTYVSAYVYGRNPHLPTSENCPVDPANPYALSKLMGEEIANLWARSYGFRLDVIRPFNVYGPEQDARFLIPTVIDQVVDGGPIKVASLTPRRDYVFVTDVATAVAATVRCDTSAGTVYNIASGKSVSVGEIVAEVQLLAGTRHAVEEVDQERSNEIPDVVGNASKARESLGWVPRVDLREGLNRCLQWRRTIRDGVSSG